MENLPTKKSRRTERERERERDKALGGEGQPRMENPPPKVVQMFEKLHTARRAEVDGKLTSAHYHDIDCAIAEVLEQLSPVFVKSAEETKQGDLPAEQPVAADSDSAKKLQALLAEHDGPLGNLAKDDKALGVLEDLFPSLQGRGELEEMLATMENVRKDVSKVEIQDAPTVSGGGEAKVQITSPDGVADDSRLAWEGFSAWMYVQLLSWQPDAESSCVVSRVSPPHLALFAWPLPCHSAWRPVSASGRGWSRISSEPAAGGGRASGRRCRNTLSSSSWA